MNKCETCGKVIYFSIEKKLVIEWNKIVMIYTLGCDCEQHSLCADSHELFESYKKETEFEDYDKVIFRDGSFEKQAMSSYKILLNSYFKSKKTSNKEC